MTPTKIIYQIMNWKAHWRAFWMGSVVAVHGGTFVLLNAVDRLFGLPRGRGWITYRGELNAAIIRGGKRIDLGCVSRRVVTNAGVTYLRDDFNDGASDINTFNYHDSGTGTNAEAVGDTALQTPAGPARVAGTKSVPASNQFRTVATINYTGAAAITEHGLFSASSAGTLWDRSVFSAINVANGDGIQFTYTLTITAGG